MPKGDSTRKLSSEQVNEIVRRYTTRLPDGTWEGTPTLAAEFGVSPTAIRHRLRQRGIQIRPNWDAASGGKRCKPIKNLPQGPQPQCKCGCGELVAWNRRKNRWNAFAAGHYAGIARRNAILRRPRPTPAAVPSRRSSARYHDRDWLTSEYVTKQRSIEEIADECGVNGSSVRRAMIKRGIQPRNPSEAHRGRQTGERNPAWKGGVAQWPYSSDWKVLARQIRTRDKWTCQDCGEQRQRWGIHLHVHHIDGNKLNNDPANLISLCAKCHVQRHRAGNLGDIEATSAA